MTATKKILVVVRPEVYQILYAEKVSRRLRGEHTSFSSIIAEALARMTP